LDDVIVYFIKDHALKCINYYYVEYFYSYEMTNDIQIILNSIGSLEIYKFN
jgi:hypothetical protein